MKRRDASGEKGSAAPAGNSGVCCQDFGHSGAGSRDPWDLVRFPIDVITDYFTTANPNQAARSPGSRKRRSCSTPRQGDSTAVDKVPQAKIRHE